MSALSPSAADLSLALFGAGGHARVVKAALERMGGRVTAVHDADPANIGRTFGSLVIRPEPTDLDGPAHIAIGSNTLRRAVASAHPNARWITIVDPAAIVADDVNIGEGALVVMGARVQTGVAIGRHAVVNTGAVVDHDCWVGDFAHIAPGVVLTGGVRVGDGALIGAGAVVLPGMSIGANAIVAAGAVVTRSVDDHQTVIGVPACPQERP